jgi:hypothetical protein
VYVIENVEAPTTNTSAFEFMATGTWTPSIRRYSREI